ncbi:MAG: protein BatD, partial [Flavobacterium sp.]
MKKTGKMKYILKILLFTCSLITFAQVKFETKVGKTSVAQNEILRVEFSMNADGDNFEPPSFEGFKIAGGPSQQVSQSW